ncbi:MAG: transposase [Verrucomicrobia bacterium]|nr:transposase [Verrucomicrobiota bacterium]
MNQDRNDYDSPWKEALEKFLRPFLALCFPAVEAQIDWLRDVVFLDKELQALQPDTEAGRQFVDKLVRVFLRDGGEAWILVHVEVQSQPDPGLAERMYHYHYRLKQVHRHPVVSLAVLADGDPLVRSGSFEEGLLGTRNRFEFPTCKLLDFSEEQLTGTANPIAPVIRAHLVALRWRRDSPHRCQGKLELLRHLNRDDYDRDTLYQLLRLMDWLLPLSPPQEHSFRQELLKLQPEKIMPFVTSFERFARQEGHQAGRTEGRLEGRMEGRQEGRQEGLHAGQMEALKEAIRDVLSTRFDQVPHELAVRLESCTDLDQLRRWLRQAVAAPNLATASQHLD